MFRWRFFKVMEFETRTCWFAFFASIGNTRIIKRCIDLHFEFLWALCFGQEINVNLAPFFIIQKVFLIWFLYTFGDRPRLHQLEIIGTLSLLLMISLGIVRYTLLDKGLKSYICSWSGRTWWRNRLEERSKCSNLLMLESTREINFCELTSLAH